MRPTIHFIKFIFLFISLSIFASYSFAQNPEKKSEVPVYNILSSNGYQNDSVNIEELSEFLMPLYELYIKPYGLMCFSGAGFIKANAVSFSNKFGLPEQTKIKFTRGTIITFTNCKFYNKEGEIVKTLHKSLFLK